MAPSFVIGTNAKICLRLIRTTPFLTQKTEMLFILQKCVRECHILQTTMPKNTCLTNKSLYKCLRLVYIGPDAKMRSQFIRNDQISTQNTQIWSQIRLGVILMEDDSPNLPAQKYIFGKNKCWRRFTS